MIKGIKRDDQLWQNPEALQFYHTFFFFQLWAGMVLFCLKRFLFSSLDSIQDASTVVFVLDNTKI